MSDPTASTRKQDHIELAFKSQVAGASLDKRFYYEPMTAAHPLPGSLPPVSLAGKTLRAPMWVSSMTGGTGAAAIINRNLARACGEFGLGMGLGSCRQLLFSDEYFSDFDVRSEMGPDGVLFANLGVAQVDELLRAKAGERIEALVSKLHADGLILHVNPMQEAMQPEGDIFARPPIEVLEELLATVRCPIIVKEVGQGFGPHSLEQLLRLPLAAIEFAAAGGTNFAMLELLRSTPEMQEIFTPLARIGHTAEEMVHFTNAALQKNGSKVKVRQLIISGGIRDFLDGYYLISKAQLPAVYGQASGFLKHARGEYEPLQQYVRQQIRGLELAFSFLKIVQ